MIAAQQESINGLVDRYARNNVCNSDFADITAFCLQVAGVEGLNTDLAYGWGNHLYGRYRDEENGRTEAAELAVEGLRSIQNLMPHIPAKARAFNYMPTEATTTARQNLQASLDNARYWIDQLGADFFGTNPKYEGSYFRGEIDEGFAITAKAGSGAGTFSVDLAIEYDLTHDRRDGMGPSHELWRLGVDTDMVAVGDGSEQRVGRIIRTGSGMKPNDERKAAEFERFRGVFRMLPQRALTFVAASVMHELDFSAGLALTTEGALTLSSLKKAKGMTDYTGIHYASGFRHPYNDFWLEAPNLSQDFHDLFVGTDAQPILLPHEPIQLDRIVDGFNRMSNPVSGDPFGIRLYDRVEEPHELAAVIAAYRSVQAKG